MRIKWPFIFTISMILIAFFVRIGFAWLHQGNFDQQSYEIVVSIMKRGGNIYAETSRYNYSPVWSFILYGLNQIPVRFHFAVRSFLTIIDISIALLLYRITGRKLVGIAYFVNPVTILLTGFHGQFENLAMLPLLAALYSIEQKPRLTVLWLLGTSSLLIKHITLFFVVFLFFIAAPNKRKALIMILSAGLVLLISFLPYLPEGRQGIIQNVILYASYKGGSYGLAGIMPSWGTLLFMAFMTVIAYIASNRQSAREGLAFMTVAYLALAPGVGEQAFILPLITAVVLSVPYFIFSGGALLFLTGSGNNITTHSYMDWSVAWIPATFWFFSSLFLTENQSGSSHWTEKIPFGKCWHSLLRGIKKPID